MAFNPGMMFKIKGAWERFIQNHPKFPMFLRAAAATGNKGRLYNRSEDHRYRGQDHLYQCEAHRFRHGSHRCHKRHEYKRKIDGQDQIY